MLLDLAGQLNSINLAESKALWPLFEAIVNSIQAIEDSPNKDRGRITIMAEREPSMQTQVMLVSIPPYLSVAQFMGFLICRPVYG